MLRFLMTAAIGFGIFLLILALVRFAKGPQHQSEAFNLFVIAVLIISVSAAVEAQPNVSIFTGKKSKVISEIEQLASGVYVYSSPRLEFWNEYWPAQITIIDSNRYGLIVAYIVYAFPASKYWLVLNANSEYPFYKKFEELGNLIKEGKVAFTESAVKQWIEKNIVDKMSLTYYEKTAKGLNVEHAKINITGTIYIQRNQISYYQDCLISAKTKDKLLNELKSAGLNSALNNTAYFVMFAAAFSKEVKSGLAFPASYSNTTIELPPGYYSSQDLSYYLASPHFFPCISAFTSLEKIGGSPGGWLVSALYTAALKIFDFFEHYVIKHFPFLWPSTGIYYILAVPTMTATATNKTNIQSSPLWTLYFRGNGIIPGTYQIGLFLLMIGMIFYAITVGMEEGSVLDWFKRIVYILIWMTLFPFYYEFMSLLFNGIALGLGLPALSIAGPFLDTTFFTTTIFGMIAGYFVPLFADFAFSVFLLNLSFVLFGLLKFLLAGTILILFPILFPLEMFPFLEGAVKRIVKVLTEIWLIGIVFGAAGAVFTAVMQGLIASMIWLQAIEPFFFALLPFVSLHIARRLGFSLTPGFGIGGLGAPGGKFGGAAAAALSGFHGGAGGGAAGAAGLAAGGAGGIGGAGAVAGAAIAAGAAAAGGLGMVTGGTTTVTMKGPISKSNIHERKEEIGGEAPPALARGREETKVGRMEMPEETPFRAAGKEEEEFGGPIEKGAEGEVGIITGPGGLSEITETEEKEEGGKEAWRELEKRMATKKALNFSDAVLAPVISKYMGMDLKEYEKRMKGLMKKLASPKFRKSLKNLKPEEKEFLRELSGRLAEQTSKHRTLKGEAASYLEIFNPYLAKPLKKINWKKYKKDMETLKKILDKAEHQGLISPEDKKILMKSFDMLKDLKKKGSFVDAYGHLLPAGVFLKTHNSRMVPHLHTREQGLLGASNALKPEEAAENEYKKSLISSLESYEEAIEGREPEPISKFTEGKGEDKKLNVLKAMKGQFGKELTEGVNKKLEFLGSLDQDKLKELKEEGGKLANLFLKEDENGQVAVKSADEVMEKLASLKKGEAEEIMKEIEEKGQKFGFGKGDEKEGALLAAIGVPIATGKPLKEVFEEELRREEHLKEKSGVKPEEAIKDENLWKAHHTAFKKIVRTEHLKHYGKMALAVSLTATHLLTTAVALMTITPLEAMMGGPVGPLTTQHIIRAHRSAWRRHRELHSSLLRAREALKERKKSMYYLELPKKKGR